MHDFAPVDMNGRSLRNVSYIAARRDNQVVLIDGDHKKVVINDFDGKCKGIRVTESHRVGGNRKHQYYRGM